MTKLKRRRSSASICDLLFIFFHAVRSSANLWVRRRRRRRRRRGGGNAQLSPGMFESQKLNTLTKSLIIQIDLSLGNKVN
jgi:hypothetical protein